MDKPLVELTTNVSQIFTELYRNYNILDNPSDNVFENALYLEGKQSQTIKQRMNDGLVQFHTSEGTLDLYINPNVDISNQVFTAGNGSTQLYKGLVYALATTYPDEQFLFVQEIPYFSGHRDAVINVFDYPNATYQGYNDPSEVNPDPGVIIVEFVTSPNNPDGKFRKPQFKTTDLNRFIIIGDFVFTSSSFGTDGNGYIKENLEWLQEYRDTNTLIFSYNSASKQFGHTGDRYGYMWFPMYDEFAAPIYNKLNNFLAITVGSNLYGSANFLDLLGPLEKYGKCLRKDANESLKIRLEHLSLALETRYPGSIIDSVPGSPTLFVKIKDSRINLQIVPIVTASDVILEDTNVKTAPGSSYGADDTYVRINIMAFSEDLSIFANRLLGNEKYKSKDFIISKNFHSHKLICDKEYTVDPNDKCLKVCANMNNVTIFLPKFLGFEQPMKLHIKRIDENKCNRVKIKSDYFTIKLCKNGFVLLKWSQPFYVDGEWKILKLHHGKERGKNVPSEVPLKVQELNQHPDVSLLYLV